VRKRIPDVLCKVYGPPVDEKYFKRCQKLVKELKLENNFVFAGKTSAPERAINEGDIFILTSISEAFPFAVLEAMACEKVVVSSDVGGVKEVLEGYGFLIKPKDYKSFADRIIYLFENPSVLAEMSIASRERVLNGFRIEDMVNNYKENYMSLAGKLHRAYR
jgi:glycosyltransferase involved in cell wall biosynthesis